MKFEALKLHAGYPLQLQLVGPGGKPLRYSCKLIGYAPGKSILVSPPQANGKLVRLVGGQKIQARLMVANGMCLFATNIETLATSPYPILHLSYPASVSFKGVRNATRVDVRLAATAHNDTALESSEISGVIADISITGARLELASDIGAIGDELTLSAPISIGSIERTLSIHAIIRSRIERSTREYDEKLPAVYGVEFIEDNEDELLTLYAYVYASMSNEQLFDLD